MLDKISDCFRAVVGEKVEHFGFDDGFEEDEIGRSYQYFRIGSHSPLKCFGVMREDLKSDFGLLSGEIYGFVKGLFAASFDLDVLINFGLLFHLNSIISQKSHSG